MAEIPTQVQNIINQAGGFHLTGSFVYVGAHKYSYQSHCHEPGCTCYPNKGASWDEETGMLDWECGLAFNVNAGNEHWKMFIVYEPSDTYSVWLLQMVKGPNVRAQLLDCAKGVYADDLALLMEAMYDRAVTERFGGVPLA
jgi:hypothetical protein